MNLQEMATKNEIEKPKVRLMEVVLNKFLKKYDWFKKIEIESIAYSEGAEGHFAIYGTMFVDEDWLYNQWREYNYSAPFPDLNDKDLGDFVGGDLAKKLRDEFIRLFVAVTELKKPRYIKWSWIRIRTEEEDNQNLIESIRRVIKESNIKNRLENLIDKVGLPQACKSVGGIEYLSKGLEVDKVELLQKYLVGKGVVEGMITTEGFGETKPIADNKTAEGMQKNRRVVLTIIKPDKTTLSAGQSV